MRPHNNNQRAIPAGTLAAAAAGLAHIVLMSVALAATTERQRLVDETDGMLAAAGGQLGGLLVPAAVLGATAASAVYSLAGAVRQQRPVMRSHCLWLARQLSVISAVFPGQNIS
eukprot:SAG22_NODE_6028_length_913_cov_1.588452_1_plen_114_part_00